MKKLILANGKYVDGTIYLYDKNKYEHLQDKEVEIQIYEKNKKRSNNYNAYYWSYIIPIIRNGLKELGNNLTLNETDIWLKQFMQSITKEQTHEFLKDRFCVNEIVNPTTGEIIKWKASTRVLDKYEFDEYVNDVIQFANETLNIKL